MPRKLLFNADGTRTLQHPKILLIARKSARISLQKTVVVVAQLVELLLPTPEIRGSNPKIGKILSTKCTFK